MTVPLDDTRPTDWTPERHAAAKVRDAEAPKGPWGVFEQDCLCWITGPTCIIGNEGQMSRSVAAFVAHAREDLPAALVEIERLTAELAARAPADCDHRAGGEVSIAGTCADCGVDFADLPDVAPADASLEAAERTWRGEWQRIAADIRSMSEAGKTPADILAILLTHLDRMKPLAVVRAVDASRPERTFPRVTLDKVAPGSLVEIASGDIGIALAAPGLRGQRPMVWIATGNVGSMPEGATVSLRATPAELDALTSADANGPTLTNEQLDALARAMPDVVNYERATPEQRRATVLDVLAIHGPRPNRSALSDIDADNTAKQLLVEMGIRDDGHVDRVARALHDIADGGKGHCDGAATTLNEDQSRAWETLYRRSAEFMATYPQNYSDEEIAMRDALRAVDDARGEGDEPKDPPRPNDKRRPALTEDHSLERMLDEKWLPLLYPYLNDEQQAELRADILRASRGETGPASEQPKTARS